SLSTPLCSSFVSTRSSTVPRCFFVQAEDGIRDFHVTGVQTCALPILAPVLITLVGINFATLIRLGSSETGRKDGGAEEQQDEERFESMHRVSPLWLLEDS